MDHENTVLRPVAGNGRSPLRVFADTTNSQPCSPSPSKTKPRSLVGSPRQRNHSPKGGSPAKHASSPLARKMRRMKPSSQKSPGVRFQPRSFSKESKPSPKLDKQACRRARQQAMKLFRSGEEKQGGRQGLRNDLERSLASRLFDPEEIRKMFEELCKSHLSQSPKIGTGRRWRRAAMAVDVEIDDVGTQTDSADEHLFSAPGEAVDPVAVCTEDASCDGSPDSVDAASQATLLTSSIACQTEIGPTLADAVTETDPFRDPTHEKLQGEILVLKQEVQRWKQTAKQQENRSCRLEEELSQLGAEQAETSMQLHDQQRHMTKELATTSTSRHALIVELRELEQRERLLRDNMAESQAYAERLQTEYDSAKEQLLRTTAMSRQLEIDNEDLRLQVTKLESEIRSTKSATAAQLRFMASMQYQVQQRLKECRAKAAGEGLAADLMTWRLTSHMECMKEELDEQMYQDAALQEHVDDLESQVSNAEGVASHYRQQAECAAAEASGQLLLIQELEADISNLQTARALDEEEYTERISCLRRILARERTRAERLETSNEASREAYDDQLTLQQRHLQELVGEHQRLIDALKNVHDASMERRQLQAQELAQSHAEEVSQLKDEIATLSCQVDSLQAETERLTKYYETKLQAQRESHEEAQAASQAQNAQQASKIQELEKEVHRLQQGVLALQGKCKYQLESLLNEHNQKVAVQARQSQAHNTAVQELKESVASLTAENEQLKEELETYRSKLCVARQQYEDMRTRQVDLETALQAKQEQVETSRMRDMEAEMDRMEEERVLLEQSYFSALMLSIKLSTIINGEGHRLRQSFSCNTLFTKARLNRIPFSDWPNWVQEHLLVPSGSPSQTPQSSHNSSRIF